MDINMKQLTQINWIKKLFIQKWSWRLYYANYQKMHSNATFFISLITLINVFLTHKRVPFYRQSSHPYKMRKIYQVLFCPQSTRVFFPPSWWPQGKIICSHKECQSAHHTNTYKQFKSDHLKGHPFQIKFILHPTVCLPF